MIVIHHIGSSNGKLYSTEGTITWFTNEDVHKNPKTGEIENKVSAHYIVPRKPYKESDVIHLVNHADIAYHAGYSQWLVEGKTRKYINNYSIGIELEGDGNLVEYTDYQYEVLIELVKNFVESYKIPEANIVGHEDIAPGRKVDPGKLFDWKRLRSGINPPIIIIPAPSVVTSEVTPIVVAPPKTPDLPSNDSVPMGGGENKVGKPKNLFSSFADFLKKLFR